MSSSRNYWFLIMLYVLLVVSLAVVFTCAVKLNSVLIRQSQNYRVHLQYHIANDYFRQGTDILSDAVRRYVATMMPEYMEEYFNESQHDRHREQAMEMVNNLSIDQTLKNSLANAMRISEKLMLTEYHAMSLIVEATGGKCLHDEVNGYPLTEEERRANLAQCHGLAQDLLWNDAYIKAKNDIYTCLGHGLESAGSAAMTQHFILRNELFLLFSVCVLGLIALAITIFGFVLYRRYQHEHLLELQAREKERMNTILKQERDKSIQAEKAKSYFFSSVSHDIRTPLNAIIGFSEMLQLGIQDESEKAKALDAIRTSGQTLLELVNDVLDLSKLEAGRMEFHPVPTDIGALVASVVTSFEAATTRISVQLRTQVSKMPYLKLDPQRIRQILFNLIGNAVKFTSRGFITVRASYANGAFILSVEDTGRGISEEDIKKLMKPYVQLQEHDSSEGTGLGLAICKQLTNQMNGTLEIASTLGKGSTFTLRIPNVRAFSDKESDAYVREHKALAVETLLPQDITTRNILVVDDQKLNRSILCTMLARLDIHKVKTANNGKEALDLMKEDGNVDVVLTDMFMPVMDGEGLVSEIRKSPKLAAIPVYAITADVEMQNKYKQKGFDNMLVKPITLEKLKNLLAQYAPHVPAGTAE
ncbi:MAG: response regulator [Victivallales bacterium]|nr:response regulator [Victivallales bacterium]